MESPEIDGILSVVVARLSRAAPDARIILFGSRARGLAHERSDVDILVVEPVVGSRFDEEIRLAREVNDLEVPVDVLVTSQAMFEKWADEPCTVIYEIAHYGRVLHAPS